MYCSFTRPWVATGMAYGVFQRAANSLGGHSPVRKIATRIQRVQNKTSGARIGNRTMHLGSSPDGHITSG